MCVFLFIQGAVYAVRDKTAITYTCPLETESRIPMSDVQTSVVSTSDSREK